LKTAPSDSSNDTFGNPIDAAVLIRKLRLLNPRIHVWQQFGDQQYPGKETGGTCMWVGEPGGTSRKITAFNMGNIPEFTVLAPDGHIIVKGWRAIFDRVVRVAKIPQATIERTFGVSLEAGEQDRVCNQCIRAHGKIVKVTGKDNLCNFHLGVRRASSRMLDFKGEQKYQRKVQGIAPGAPVTIPDVKFGKERFIYVSDNAKDPRLR
jgi:hypothetical protein